MRGSRHKSERTGTDGACKEQSFLETSIPNAWKRPRNQRHPKLSTLTIALMKAHRAMAWAGFGHDKARHPTSFVGPSGPTPPTPWEGAGTLASG